MSDFRKKISPQLGLEPTKMSQDLRKSVSILPERDRKIISFGCDFNNNFGLNLESQFQNANLIKNPKWYLIVQFHLGKPTRSPETQVKNPA